MPDVGRGCIIGQLGKAAYLVNFYKVLAFQCIHFFVAMDTQLTFHLAGDPRPRVFHSARGDTIQITGLITAQLKNVFPVTQLE